MPKRDPDRNIAALWPPSPCYGPAHHAPKPHGCGVVLAELSAPGWPCEVALGWKKKIQIQGRCPIGPHRRSQPSCLLAHLARLPEPAVDKAATTTVTPTSTTTTTTTR